MKCILSILLIFTSILTIAKTLDYKKEDIKLSEEWSAIYKGLNYASLTDSQLTEARIRYRVFRNHLLSVFSNREALSYKFPLLSVGINIQTSPDHKLRLLNWTVPANFLYVENSYGHAIQFIDEFEKMHFTWGDTTFLNEVYQESKITDSDNIVISDDVGVPSANSITSIEEVKAKDKMIYLIFDFTSVMGQIAFTSINACQILGDSIKRNLPLFYWHNHTNTEIINEYENIASWEQRLELEVKYNRTTQTIYFTESDYGSSADSITDEIQSDSLDSTTGNVDSVFLQKPVEQDSTDDSLKSSRKITALQFDGTVFRKVTQ